MRADLRLQQMQARVERLSLEFAALEREGRGLVADKGVALLPMAPTAIQGANISPEMVSMA